MHRVLISRITHGLDTIPQSVFPVLLTLLWPVILAVSSVQARVLDFTVEVNQAGPRFTVQANNANTLHWMRGEGSRSIASADVLTVVSSSNRDAPPDDKPHKPCDIWPGFNTLIESVSWQSLYAREMVMVYRLWLSLQENSLLIKGFSWWPVVAGIVSGTFVYTWWHSEAPSFHQWEEQQQHRVSNLKIITCMDHPPGQSGYPQGGGRPGVSNQWTGGYHNWGNGSSVYGSYGPSDGEGGGYYPHDGHTHNYRPCPACYQQPCQYPVESSSCYYGQPDSSMNGALALSCYPPGPEVSINYGDRDWIEYQGGNSMAQSTFSATGSATSSETSRVFTQQEPAVHEQESVPPPAPGWLSDHEPNHPGCVCRHCLDLFIEYTTIYDGQGDNYMEGTTSVENSDVSGRPTALVSPWVATTNESDVHQQPGSVEESEPPSKKSRQSSQQKTPGRRWACSYSGCTKSYSRVQRLKEHEASHEGKKWACSYSGCTKAYSRVQRLKEHEASHEGKWACSYPGCIKSYSSAQSIKEHEASHQGKWACSHPGCTKSYSSAQGIRDHEASHQGKWACSHPGCTRSYSNAHSLKEHKASHQGKLTCSHPGCTKSYSSTQNLKEHEASHEGKWICSHPGCTKSYSRAQVLREHKASHQGKWTCTYPGCTRSYKTAHKLREHKASHEGKLTCSHPGCTKSYSSTQNLKEHEASHEGKWTCSHPGCTKSYSRAQTLKEHKASHQGKWTCPHPGCTKSYSSTQGMREHEASHEGKWACSHPGCTKSYSSAHNLKEHKASHQGKWTCTYPGCTRSYSNPQGLKRHKTSHK